MSTSVVATGGGNGLPSHAGYPSADWGAPPAPDRGGAGLQQLITRTLAAIKRYRWLILAVFVVGSATGIALTRFVKPKYTVDATIWIAENQSAKGPVQAPGLISSDLGWTDLVKSFIILDPVVSKLGLYVRPAEGGDSAFFRGLQPSDSLITTRRPRCSGTARPTRKSSTSSTHSASSCRACKRRRCVSGWSRA